MMKLVLFIIISMMGTAHAQVNCNERTSDFSGKCESFDSYSGVRAEYSYKNGEMHGTFNEMYRNGQLRSSGKFKRGLLNGKIESFYETGEKFAAAKFKSGSGDFNHYYKNGQVKLKGRFENGSPQGTWSYFNEVGENTRSVQMDDQRVDMLATMTDPAYSSHSGRSLFGNWDFGDMSMPSFEGFSMNVDSMMQEMRSNLEEMMKGFDEQMKGMNFSDSSFSSFHFDTTFTFDGFGGGFDFFSDSSFNRSFKVDTTFSFDSRGANPYFGENTRDLVDFPDEEPSFIGGEEAMNRFIKKEMRYPKAVKDRNGQGTVFVEVIVEKDGSLSQPKIALGSNELLLNQEAIRIVEAMPNWKPAQAKESSVRTRSIIPVIFEL